MGWTARIDTAPLTHFLGVSGTTIAWLVIMIIVAFTGPTMLQAQSHSTWHCKLDNHTTWNATDCNGVQMGLGHSSPLYTMETGLLNKYWYVELTPYSSANETVYKNIIVHTAIYGDIRNKTWHNIYHGSIGSILDCPDPKSQCQPFIAVYKESIEWEGYAVVINITDENGNPVPILADVVFTLMRQNAEFSKMALSLHFIYLVITCVLFAWQLMKLRGEKPSPEMWSLEQKLLISLVFALTLYDNPFYPLEYMVRNWFMDFFGQMMELIFTVTLFAIWFLLVNKLRSEEDELEWTIFVKLELALVGLYAIFGTILFGWSTGKDSVTPLLGLSDQVSGLDVMFLITASLYVWMGLAFCLQLVLTLAITSEKRQDRRIRFYFFAIPSLLAVMAILTGVFTGTIGPFGRDTPSFVFFISMFNVYTYLLLWGYWPVSTAILTASNPTEGTKIFPDAEYPQHQEL